MIPWKWLGGALAGVVLAVMSLDHGPPKLPTFEEAMAQYDETHPDERVSRELCEQTLPSDKRDFIPACTQQVLAKLHYQQRMR
jgi:hypothetical protein